MTVPTAPPGAAPRRTGSSVARKDRAVDRAIVLLGRGGLAGRTFFYMILTALVVRIAVLGGAKGPQADAQGALQLVSRSVFGKIGIAAVALGFLIFGAGRLAGAWRDESVSGTRRVLTLIQGLFYFGLAYVPCSYLAGNADSGSQEQQVKTTARLLRLPGGTVIVVIIGVVLVYVCVQQIRGAVGRTFLEGLDLSGAPPVVCDHVERLGVYGLTARALVFLPVGLFLIVSAVDANPNASLGTDGELLKLTGYKWGIAALAAVAAGLAVFTLYSSVEARYRRVISAR